MLFFLNFIRFAVTHSTLTFNNLSHTEIRHTAYGFAYIQPRRAAFWGFQSSRPPGAGVARRPNMGAENWNFPEIAQNHDCGGSMVLSGSPEH